LRGHQTDVVWVEQLSLLEVNSIPDRDARLIDHAISWRETTPSHCMSQRPGARRIMTRRMTHQNFTSP
jgi:hypothetical protein